MADAERDQILKAAFELMTSPHGPSVSVHAILEQSGLSTRAFYRHFPSKDELILTMYRTAAQRVIDELSAVVAVADEDVLAAFRRWVHQHYAVVYSQRRAKQTALLMSPELRRVPGFEAVDQETAARRRDLLAQVINAGQVAGVFPLATDPQEDARAVISVMGGIMMAKIAGQPVPTWDEAAAHTTNLFLRAFGAPTAS